MADSRITQQQLQEWETLLQEREKQVQEREKRVQQILDKANEIARANGGRSVNSASKKPQPYFDGNNTPYSAQRHAAHMKSATLILDELEEMVNQMENRSKKP